MINDRIIKFFSNHNLYNKEMFDYFKKNNNITYKQIYKKKVEDEKKMIINIHEKVNAIKMYYN